MGLQVTYTNGQGIEFTESYWKISNINFHPIRRIFDVEITGYKDVAAKTAGKQPIEYRHYSLPPEYFADWQAKVVDSETNGNILQVAYNMIKEEPVRIDMMPTEFFKNAIDIV